ncbi:MAG: WXG100 family type VII secretion target [Lachnospiraceae bacterium]|nr:WXG100 family type VII secretion target [Lachnospiraceae bacterium]
MAANRINVSPAEMRDYAVKLGLVKENLEQILSNLDDCMDRLAEEWTGEAYDGYAEQYQKIRFKLEKTIDYINSFIEAIRQTAKNFEEADAQIAQSIRSML